MLWALINPLDEARTDFGAIFPVMVLTKRILPSAVLESALALASVKLLRRKLLKNKVKIRIRIKAGGNPFLLPGKNVKLDT
jgi:hypothetical protein